MEKRTDWLDRLGSRNSLFQSILNSSYLDLCFYDFNFLYTDLYGPLFRLYLNKASLDFPSHDSLILGRIVDVEVIRLTSFMNELGYIRKTITEKGADNLLNLRRRLVELRNEVIAFYRGFSGRRGFAGSQQRRYLTMYGRAMEDVLGRKLHVGELEVLFVKDKLAKDLVKRVIEWCTEGIRFLGRGD